MCPKVASTPIGLWPDRESRIHRPHAGGLSFYDRWVRGTEHALDGTAPVKVFVMGIDQWREEQEWPLPDAIATSYFLSSEETANTAAGDGILTTDRPADSEMYVYMYDPRRPVPTTGGQIVQAPNQRQG